MPGATGRNDGTRGRLEVRLLGEVTVKLDGDRLAGFDSPRLQRLLAQLSLVDGGRNRARLAYALWMDSAESKARANLRKLLHDFRRALPDAERFVEIGNQSVRWRTGAPVSVDVVELRAALARGELVEAAHHYGGDLLPACYDDWVIAERERLRAEAVDVLLRLGTEASESGHDESAAAFARQVLAIDSVCEPAYRLLMLAKARCGDRAEALRAYHRCVEVLDQEIGVEPDDATRAAYEALRAGAPATAHATAPSTVVSASPPLVGRDVEYEAALATWQAAAEGRAHLLLVTGEAGIGKTRLVEELARAVGVQGCPVARTRSYQAAGRPPWGPVVDWIRSNPLRTNLDRLEPIWLTEVARLLPELRTTHPDLPPPAPVSEAARHHLFDALSRALIAGDRPLLLVIDDLQWCDAETVEMIGFLLRAAPAAPLLVAATVRIEEVDEPHPVTGLRLGLTRDGAVTEIALGRLDAASTSDLASGLIGRSLEPTTADRLWRETEGHPLFVVEAARTGLPPDGGRTSLSPTVHAVISARLSQLSPAARDLVEVAATVGRSFTVEVLAAASGAGVDDLVDALDELWQRQIVRELGTGYDFTHDRIREVVHDLIAPARRRRLHGAVAKALADIHRDDLGVVSALLARHYEQAGLISEAVAAYSRAGQWSVDVSALEDAIGAFRHALVLLEELPADRWRDERELELRIGLGVPLVAREGYGSDAVRDAYERALALCHCLDRNVDPPVLRGLGLASLMACRFDRASQLGDALLRDAGTDPTAGAEGHYLLGVSSFWRGDLAGAARHLQAAIDAFQAEHAGDHLALYGQDPKAVCTIRLALAELWRGRPDSSRALAEDALRRVASLDHPTTHGYVRLYTAMIAAEREEPGLLAGEVAAGEAVWSRQQLGYFMQVGRLFRGWLDVLAGEDRGTRGLADAVAGWRHRAQTLHFTYGLLLLTRARLRGGEVEAGRASAAEGIRWSTAHDQGYAESELRRLDGELLVLAGERHAAMEAFEHSLDVARSQGCRWFEMKTACSLARHDPKPATRALLEGVLATFDEGRALPLVREARSLVAGA